MQGGAKQFEHAVVHAVVYEVVHAVVDEVVHAVVDKVVHAIVDEVVPNARRLVDDDDDGDAAREVIADELGASGSNLIK
jgi:hypothetical protein